MCPGLVLLLTVAAVPAQPARPWLPIDAAHAAVADARALPAGLSQYTRYLDIGHIPAVDRPSLIGVLGGHINSLSTEEMAPPKIVPGTRGALLRLNLLDYGAAWQVAWEQLATADPWYQLELNRRESVRWPGGRWTDGKVYAAGSFRVLRRTKVRVLAPWLSEGPGGQVALARLVALTQSRAPIVRGDWFLWQTAIQQGRAPGYYDFLGIRDQKGFEAVIRFDARLARRLEQRRAVVFSGIALQPRRVERTATVLGGLWRTFDVELATGRSNPLRILDDKDFVFQATRQFAPLLNGLPAWWLGNDKGVRQNKAPDQIIGGDRLGGGVDTQLHIGLGCIRCHFAGKRDGIQPIIAAPLRKVSSPDYERQRELTRQYLRDVSPLILKDQAGYAAAVAEATGGLTTAEYGREYQRWYSWYDDARVDAARAAADMGVSEAALLAALRALDRRGTLDSVLSIVSSGGAIPIQQWAEVFPLAQAAVRGFVLPPDYEGR